MKGVERTETVVDFGPLINPPKEPTRWLMTSIDALSWSLPVVSALLSGGAGVEALWKLDDLAAYLGIFGAVAGALGVVFTNWASRVRDHRLTIAQGIGSLAVDIATRVDSRTSTQF